tara:strand:+ start:235 stop:1332 length:1098 start_codon:yes stop_codon:yes gene_type:complete
MNVLWVKDKKIGHEKQVKVLLDELSKLNEINIFEDEVSITFEDKLVGNLNIFSNKLSHWFNMLNNFLGSGDEESYIWVIQRLFKDKNIDIIIGAGHGTYSRILQLKEALSLKLIPASKISAKDFMSSHYVKDKNTNIKAIAVLTPSFRLKDFDLICAPNHDSYRLKAIDDNKKIFYEGSLAKVYDQLPNEDIGFIGLGGENKHFKFDVNNLFKQIQYITSLYPSKNWYIFNSRRTPKELNKLITDYIEINKMSNVSFENFNDTNASSYDEIISQSSIKVVTQDSVNMVYESLSSKGETILFNMNYIKMNKIVKLIHNLLKNKKVGYIDDGDLADGLKAIKIVKQHDRTVYAEVEKLAYRINKYIK